MFPGLSSVFVKVYRKRMEVMTQMTKTGWRVNCYRTTGSTIKQVLTLLVLPVQVVTEYVSSVFDFWGFRY